MKQEIIYWSEQHQLTLAALIKSTLDTGATIQSVTALSYHNKYGSSLDMSSAIIIVNILP